MARAALLDLDGTLVDTNYQHALAWFRAFHRFGMGGDQYVAAVAGDDVEQRHGGDLRDAHDEEFERLRDECEPLDGARELLAELKKRRLELVIASSSDEGDLEFFVDKLEARDFLDDWTSKDDVERTKPHPDPIEAALEKAGTRDGVMIGDSRWDIEAAAKAGLPTICTLTGGWSEQELRDHGAVAVFESIPQLLDHLDETPLG